MSTCFGNKAERFLEMIQPVFENRRSPGTDVAERLRYRLATGAMWGILKPYPSTTPVDPHPDQAQAAKSSLRLPDERWRHKPPTRNHHQR